MLPVLCSARGIIEVMCFIDIGNELFSVILFNIFHIVLEIESLSQQQQLLFYIDLVCGVFTGTIQFEQSMPRPIVPNVCCVNIYWTSLAMGASNGMRSKPRNRLHNPMAQPS
eukprot:351530_1